MKPESHLLQFATGVLVEYLFVYVCAWPVPGKLGFLVRSLSESPVNFCNQLAKDVWEAVAFSGMAKAIDFP